MEPKIFWSAKAERVGRDKGLISGSKMIKGVMKLSTAKGATGTPQEKEDLSACRVSLLWTTYPGLLLSPGTTQILMGDWCSKG